MSVPGSVTDLIERVKAGDAEAAQRLWDIYAQRLLGLVRRRLAGSPVGPADEEDVVLNALDSFFRGAGSGRFPNLHDRDDLWHLLVVLTTRKAIDLLAHHARQKRRPPAAGKEEAARLNDVVDSRPPPDIEAQLAEECQRLLQRLGDARLQAIAVWKLEGYTDAEIAARLGCSLRTVERKLCVIRSILGTGQQP